MESKAKMVAFEIEFMDGVRCVVWERTYSAACARAAYARCEAGAMSHRELHVVKGDRWPGFDDLHEDSPAVAFVGRGRCDREKMDRKVSRTPVEDLDNAGFCAQCGQPVRHSFPWWVGTPGMGGKPLHDECAKEWGLW